MTVNLTGKSSEIGKICVRSATKSAGFAFFTLYAKNIQRGRQHIQEMYLKDGFGSDRSERIKDLRRQTWRFLDRQTQMIKDFSNCSFSQNNDDDFQSSAMLQTMLNADIEHRF
ncbi:MAG: hypothetical protein IPI97_08565 [Nitrosomonas sp.]|nr:hypothetical protein [Nitrosomonas sp.]MBK7365031.1 hypothetical protein [Nitrosomonas sp.]